MIVETLALAVGLGMDAMSVCLGIGVRWNGWRQRFRMAWHMGLFQFLMPVVGWLIGRPLAEHITGWGKYAAAALVFGVGAKMLHEALKKDGAETRRCVDAERAQGHREMVRDGSAVPAPPCPRVPAPAGRDPTRGWSLVVLSVATSLDALVVGFSLELRSPGVSIWWPSVVIGVVAAAMALVGIVVGKHMGKKLGPWAEILGAIVLMAIGASFVVFG